MTLTDALHRRLIAGLRALAEFLESRPEVPVPFTVDATVFAETDNDEAMRTEIDHIAYAAARGHYRTGVEFGPAQYRAVAVLAAARACYDALMSYSGVVRPDTGQAV